MLEVFIKLMTLMCMALEVIQQNIITQLFLSACPPLVCLVTALLFDLSMIVSDRQQGYVVILWEDYWVFLSIIHASIPLECLQAR